MTTRRGWLLLAAVFILAVAAVARWGPTEQRPERALEASTTAEPGPPAPLGLPTGLRPYSAAETATRAPRPDPLAGFEGRYRCRFATAGRTTPCCPDATATLAVYWTGPDLAVADYIVGRESGCRASIVNTAGCVGWFQLCGKTCDGSCRDPEANTAEAFDLFLARGWCDWYLRGDPVTGGAC